MYDLQKISNDQFPNWRPLLPKVAILNRLLNKIHRHFKVMVAKDNMQNIWRIFD